MIVIDLLFHCFESAVHMYVKCICRVAHHTSFDCGMPASCIKSHTNVALCRRCFVQCKKIKGGAENGLRCGGIAPSLCKQGFSLVLMSSIPGESGWGKLWRTYRNQFCNTEISQCVTTGDIKSFLDSKGVRYQSYELPSQMDITECFTEGDEKGELLLDFLTEVLDFSKTASPELKAGVMELLRHPDCSVESNGKVIFNNNLGVIVMDQLS